MSTNTNLVELSLTTNREALLRTPLKMLTPHHVIACKASGSGAEDFSFVEHGLELHNHRYP